MCSGAFVSPLHDGPKNDFRWGMNLLKSAQRFGISENLYFVFSSNEEAARFAEITHGGGHYLVIDITLEGCKCPVSVKKFWGLQQLMHSYDYIATIDCECEFLKQFKPGKIMQEIWESGSFLTANRSRDFAKTIMRDCSQLLGLGSENSRVRQATEDYLYYWWFNEIPVYRTDTLGEFFSWLDEQGRREAVFKNWCCFDYIVYVMWLIDSRNVSIRKIDVEAGCGITEELFSHKKDLADFERICGLHWTSRPSPSLTGSKVVMKFHLDRRKNHASLFRKFKQAAKHVLRILKLRRQE